MFTASRARAPVLSTSGGDSTSGGRPPSMIKRQASVKMLHRESLLNRPTGTCVDPNDQFGLLIHQTTYVADEPVAKLRYRLDVLRPTLISIERFAQDQDVPRQIVLFDKAVGLDCLHQLIFPDQPSAVPNQDQQRLKNLRLQRHPLAVTQQQVFCRIEPEGAELE